QTPPMTRLPDWAVPESYDLAIKSDPKQADYSGAVTIAVALKKTSNYLWLHGKDLKVFSGAVTKVAEKVGVARVDFGATLQPQKIKLKLDFTAPYNGTLQGYYKVVFAGDAYAM